MYLPRTLLIAMGAVFLPVMVHAEGLNLSWDDCGVAGAPLRTFACNTNSGSDLLVASAQPPANMDSICGFSATIRVSSTMPVVPDWWKFRAPNQSINPIHPPCRDTSAVKLSLNAPGLLCQPLMDYDATVYIDEIDPTGDESF